MEISFDYVLAQFKKCSRDAHSVLHWLTGPPVDGGKNIPEPIVIEVMFEFAHHIEAGAHFAFREDGLSELSLAVFEVCEKRNRAIKSEGAVRTLRALAGKPLLEKEVYELTDMLLEMDEILYTKLDALQDRPARRKQFKRNRSSIRHPFRVGFPKLWRTIKATWHWLEIRR